MRIRSLLPLLLAGAATCVTGQTLNCTSISSASLQYWGSAASWTGCDGGTPVNGSVSGPIYNVTLGSDLTLGSSVSPAIPAVNPGIAALNVPYGTTLHLAGQTLTAIPTPGFS